MVADVFSNALIQFIKGKLVWHGSLPVDQRFSIFPAKLESAMPHTSHAAPIAATLTPLPPRVLLLSALNIPDAYPYI